MNGAAALAAAVKLATEVSEEIGFSPPPPDGSLADWTRVLDSPLAPRGGPAWVEAHAALVDAYEAALAGSRTILRDRLILARDLVRAHGNLYCECLDRGPLVRDPSTGRPLCFRCTRRRR